MSNAGAEVVGIEYALPSSVLTNDELQSMHPDWDMAAVYPKTGVLFRHIAGPAECASDLAYDACVRLLDSTGVDRGSIDGLIVCTQSADWVMPHTAALLQHRLGLGKHVAAFDYTLACSGFVYGLAICKAFIESELLRSVVLVTCDTYSKYLRADDRATRTLFGDAAAATLIQRGSAAIGEVVLATDGSGADHFIVRGGGCRSAHLPASDLKHIEMDGFAVLSFVKKEVPGCVEQLLAKSDLRRKDIDLFIFHQASQVSLDMLTKILGVGPDKTFSNLKDLGNTVSSSIPIAIKDAWVAGKIRPGMITALIGFGVGFSWGGAVVRWPRSLSGVAR